MAKIPISAEQGFVVASLLIASGTVSGILGIFGRPIGTTDTLLQALWLVIYLLIIALLYALRKRTVRVIGKDKFLWLLVGLALFSALWSIVPSVTLRRTLALVGTNLFGVYLATRYSLQEQLRLLAWALGIAAIISFVVSIGIPSYGTNSAGQWQGIFGQRNVLARLMVLSSMVFLLISLSSHKHRWIPWAMFGLSVFLMLRADSKTSLVCFMTLLVLLIPYRALRFHYTLAIPVSIFCILAMGGAATLLLSSSEVLLNSLGKDATLTGRTQLWENVLAMIGKQPILGYGYGGFWIEGPNSPASYIWLVNRWHPIHAHNGFLNLGLDLGLLGLLIFVIGYVMLATRSVHWLRSMKTAEGFWPIVYVTFLLMFNLTESSLLSSNGLFWILYVAVSFSSPIQQLKAKNMV